MRNVEGRAGRKAFRATGLGTDERNAQRTKRIKKLDFFLFKRQRWLVIAHLATLLYSGGVACL